MTRLFAMMAFLVGCSSTPAGSRFLGEPPEFEWVEPVIFQHNLEICRSSDTCRAETLFG